MYCAHPPAAGLAPPWSAAAKYCRVDPPTGCLQAPLECCRQVLAGGHKPPPRATVQPLVVSAAHNLFD
jgi:hypothetical protein